MNDDHLSTIFLLKLFSFYIIRKKWRVNYKFQTNRKQTQYVSCRWMTNTIWLLKSCCGFFLHKYANNGATTPAKVLKHFFIAGREWFGVCFWIIHMHIHSNWFDLQLHDDSNNNEIQKMAIIFSCYHLSYQLFHQLVVGVKKTKLKANRLKTGKGKDEEEILTHIIGAIGEMSFGERNQFAVDADVLLARLLDYIHGANKPEFIALTLYVMPWI